MDHSALMVQLLHVAQTSAAHMAASGIFILAEIELPWQTIIDQLHGQRLFIAARDATARDQLRQYADVILLEMDPHTLPARELLSLALLEALAAEQLPRGGVVLALYNNLGTGGAKDLDTLSVISVGENLEQLQASDLRQLDTMVPLKTLKAVVDLAVEIGREGREGKPTGTLFVVGDTRKVLTLSHALGFDPVHGYSRAERNLRDRRVRESIKEIAKLDGAFLVDKDGTVCASARYIDVQADGITLSKGLGSRHWTAAAVSKRSHAVAVAVSESTGVVRVFHQGEIRLFIPPFARPILWRSLRDETANSPQVPTDERRKS